MLPKLKCITHQLALVNLAHNIRKRFAHSLQGYMTQPTVLKYHLSLLLLVTTAKAVLDLSVLLYKNHRPLRLMPLPSILHVFLSSIK